MRALKFFREPPRRQRLVVEALVAVAAAWWRVRWRRFDAYASGLGEVHPGAFEAMPALDLPEAREVAWAVGVANRTFAGQGTCLIQGIAAKTMLKRRGIANTLVLGARLDGEGDALRDGGLAAHAWLAVGPEVLLGGEIRDGYVPVTSYHTPGRG